MNAPQRSVRVLLVDDRPAFAETAAALLEREDDRFEATTATSASEGLERLATDEIDCIVSDYEMPGLDGVEFFEAVRGDHPEVPFVLFTDSDVGHDAVPAGVFDVLRKSPCPDQCRALADRVRRAVETTPLRRRDTRQRSSRRSRSP